jgi:hypothetical protein
VLIGAQSVLAAVLVAAAFLMLIVLMHMRPWQRRTSGSGRLTVMGKPYTVLYEHYKQGGKERFEGVPAKYVSFSAVLSTENSRFRQSLPSPRSIPATLTMQGQRFSLHLEEEAPNSHNARGVTTYHCHHVQADSERENLVWEIDITFTHVDSGDTPWFRCTRRVGNIQTHQPSFLDQLNKHRTV